MPDLPKRSTKVVAAVLVATGVAEELVARDVASGEEQVVHAGTGVLGERDDRTAKVAVEPIPHLHSKTGERGARMRHRHVLLEIGKGERPGVDDLASVRVDDLQALTAAKAKRATPTRRDDLRSRSG
jgi:hypothetical protein